jgi:hypothetical protein
MNPIDRENQSDPELVIDLEHKPDGWAVQVRRGGKVRYVDQGYKTRDAAWEAGRFFVRGWLKAQIGASGIGRCGERPAFLEAPPQTTAITWHPGEPLEDEQLCVCGHSDGVHGLGVNDCHVHECPCGEFQPVAQVEAVQ